jgi:hypothetical protein
MGLLIVTPADRAKIKEMEVYARHTDHWYRPGVSEVIPGNDERHTTLVGTYRVVFSWTLAPDGALLRHLSVSSLTPQTIPGAVVALSLATLFGFTGGGVTDNDFVTLKPGVDWFIGTAADDPSVVVLAQEI